MFDLTPVALARAKQNLSTADPLVSPFAAFVIALIDEIESLRAPEERPACSGCGGPHPFDTSIPSVVWNEVIRGQGLHDYLCTSCIVAAFAKARRSFTATLYGAGLDGITCDVSIGGQVADDAHRIQEQNNHLRATLDEIREKADEELTRACRAEGRG